MPPDNNLTIDKVVDIIKDMIIPGDLIEFWSYMFFWAQNINENYSPYTLLDDILEAHYNVAK